MRIRGKTVVCAAVLGVALAGCNGDSDARSKMPTVEPEGDCLMSELPEKAVFLRVNGREFTRGDFEAISSMYDMMNRTRARDSLTGPNPNAEEAIAVMAPSIVAEIRRRELLRQFAEKNGVEPTPADIGEVTTNLMFYLRRTDPTAEKIAGEFGPEQGKILLEYLKGDATDIALRRFVDTENTLNITEADVIAASNRFEAFTAQAIASNNFEKAVLERALKEIADGTNFIEVAKRYSERPDDAIDWGDFDNEDLEDEPELLAWVPKANEGDVSKIIELDDSWSVVRVAAIERDEDDLEDVTWKLVRICRPLWELPPELDHDETVDGIREYRTNKLQRLIGDKIMETAVVEWPHGTNLFNRVTSKKSVSLPKLAR